MLSDDNLFFVFILNVFIFYGCRLMSCYFSRTVAVYLLLNLWLCGCCRGAVEKEEAF